MPRGSIGRGPATYPVPWLAVFVPLGSSRMVSGGTSPSACSTKAGRHRFDAAPPFDIFSPSMAPPWFTRLVSLMKRSRRGKRVTHYTISDDNDNDNNDNAAKASTTLSFDRHRHVDISHGDAHVSHRTSFTSILREPRKRPRSSSLPSLTPVNCSYNDSAVDLSSSDPVDLDYLFSRLAEIDEDPVPRRRTAAVCLASFPHPHIDAHIFTGPTASSVA